MLLTDALALPKDGGIVFLVGGGGKTSLLYGLAHQLQADSSVCVTTTTHICKPAPQDACWVDEGDEAGLLQALEQRRAVAIGSETNLTDEAGCPKIAAPSARWYAQVRPRVSWVLCEADGARHCPAKVPAAHEPVLTLPGGSCSFSEPPYVVAVFGLSALEKPLSRVCFRWEQALPLLHVSDPETPLTVSMAASLLTSPWGQCKGVPDLSRYRIFLNQADDDHGLQQAASLSSALHSVLPAVPVAAGSLRKGVYVSC